MKKGPDAFHEYYEKIFGSRWEKLSHALLQEHIYWGLHPQKGLLEAPPKNSKDYYYLDPASAKMARLIAEYARGDIVDLCSAPGGKSLVLWALGSQKIDSLILNEISSTRLGRLRKNWHQFFPDAGIKTYNHDAKRWGMNRPESADIVILDAPCSSERHLMEKNELDNWRAGRTKRLSKEQRTLLASAFDTLRPGGLLFYSTCSLSPLENEEVVKKIIQKREFARIRDFELEGSGPRELGRIFLPDEIGEGPLYLCIIEKALHK